MSLVSPGPGEGAGEEPSIPHPEERHVTLLEGLVKAYDWQGIMVGDGSDGGDLPYP